MTIVLAADLGGSTVKAGLVGGAGRILAAASFPAPKAATDGLFAPTDWWDRFVDAARALQAADAAAFAGVAAIAVTGVTRTPVVLDAQGTPVVGAIEARDARAQEIAARTTIDPAGCPEAARYDAFHPAARLKWLTREHPQAIARAAAVVDPKDFINARLTGRIASDAIALARLVAAADRSHGGASLLSRLGLSEQLVPQLAKPATIIAPVQADLPAPLGALAGKPVIMVSHDTWAGVLGLGALTAGRAYNVSGTTETFGVMGPRAVRAEGLMDVQWGDALHQIGGPGQNGADVLTWLGGILGADPSNAGASIQAALAQPRHPAPLLFLPYLSGERVPFWDADLRAAFLGLSREHGAADFVWSALEGIACVNRITLQRAETAAALTVDEVRLGGGAARITEWAQVKADILERPVVTVAVEETGVFGAALAGFVGLGTVATLEAAQQLLVRVARRFQPQRRNRDFYRALGLLFGRAHAAVHPVSHELVRLRIPDDARGMGD